MTTVAIVGTGRMGSAMAHAQRAAGNAVVLQNRTLARARTCAAELGEGVRVVETPAEAAAAADVSISMLADDEAVVAAWTGPDGMIAGAPAGSVLVDCSTVRPRVIESLEAEKKDSVLVAPIRARVETRLAEPGEVLPAGGRVYSLLDLSDVYMYIFLPAATAGKLSIGSEARIVLYAAPDFPIRTTVSFVSPASAPAPPSNTATSTSRTMLRPPQS